MKIFSTRKQAATPGATISGGQAAIIPQNIEVSIPNNSKVDGHSNY